MLSLRLSSTVTGLPIDVAQMASKMGLRSPISLRALITADGTRTRRPRICVLRYRWQTPRPGPKFQNRIHPRRGSLWPDNFMYELLEAHNGWSLRDYWYRSTFGLIDLEFVVQPWRVLPKDQGSKEANGPESRKDVISWCKAQAIADGVKLEGFTHIIAFLHPGQNNAGAYGRDALFDDTPFSLEFYQHEMGHMLGFSHAFGPVGDYVYEDPWCIMGRSRNLEHPVPIPPNLGDVNIEEPEAFWHAGPRLSTAALFRYDSATNFWSTSGVRRVDVSHASTDVELVPSSEGGLHSPTVAVVECENFKLTIEYRVPTADDAWLKGKNKARPVIVLHSIGRRETLRWQSEDSPVWIEAEIGAEPGAKTVVHDAWNEPPNGLLVEVAGANSSRAVVEVSRS